MEAEAWAIASGADIYTCFAEMSEFTGTYSLEAAEMRRPLQDRDARLIRNGFMRQARGDFLELRRMVKMEREKNAALTGQKKGKGGASKGAGRQGSKHKGAGAGRSSKMDKGRKSLNTSTHGGDASTHGTLGGEGDETEGEGEGDDLTSRVDTPDGPGLRHSHSYSHISGRD